MKFKIMILLVAMTLVFSNYVLAAETRDQIGDKQLVRVGNALCPVSGENVKSIGGGTEYEYNGKIYNLCCPGCADMFKKDPEKYSKIAEKNAV
ncbi:MAG: YHS domain-containing protein [Candidatus Omnitrophica bacterium]|nr:YHS domain-containing protein [Candidatus Omnitrophota bacterium]